MLTIHSPKASAIIVSVFNAKGQKVLEQKVSITTGASDHILPANTLSNGIYTISVNDGMWKQTAQFIKQ